MVVVIVQNREKMELKVLCLIAVVSFTTIKCQTIPPNAGTGVASQLMDCYNNTAIPDVLSANGRPPATINILLEYIRKIEDANPTISARELSLLLIHRFRQDGIKISERSRTNNRFGIPYSPRSLETYKYRTILTSLLPSSQQTLSNGDLNPMQYCSLHYMISSTIDKTRRGDESSVCARTSRYTSRIIKRRKRDIELTNPNSDDFGVMSIETLSNGNISQCPLELGVVFTNYGTIKAGSVLAGIATGMNQQNVGSVDNRFAGTIAGELTEASLYQADDSIEIGAQGGWNSTINPRYYFLQKNNLLHATDAEIRGSLDGLYMGLQMSSWTSTFADIKVSQMIDMYYSPYQRGVFNSSITACNRNILYTSMTTTEMMSNQVLYFMPLLNQAATFGATLTNNSFEVFTTAGISSFNNYLPQMNTTDLNCKPDDTNIERVAADLWIFLDASWTYTTVQPVLSYILDNSDVNKFGSKYTLFNGMTGENITTNSTNYLSDFHEQYNLTVHQSQTSNFDYIKVFESIEAIGKVKLDNNSYTGGESTIILLVPRSTPTEDQRNYVEQRRNVIRQYLPDLNILVLGRGSQSDYNNIVTNTEDVVILTETTNEDTLKQTGQNVVNKIKNVPRSVVNPNCGSSFSGSASTFSVTQTVEPRGINYYRISSNYFYNGNTRYLKIRELSTGTITVCTSRDQNKPDNTTSECESLTNNERSIDISGFCEGSSITGCPPIYVSVGGNASNINCRGCRFPDEVRYSITLENVGCASGSIRHLASLVVASLFFMILRF